MVDKGKIMSIANFNITYGADLAPMLSHLHDIIYPAFSEGTKKGSQSPKKIYYLSNVKIKMINKEYVLVGDYIKDTVYDIYTTSTEDGKLIQNPSSVPTAPYSRFIVFLKNHRMVLIKNEKESPNVKSFQAHVRYILRKYVTSFNKTVDDKNKKLPYAEVNIVDIPLKEDIAKVIAEVKRIRYFNLRFFQLNGDISPFPLNDVFRSEMKDLQCKNGIAQFNAPKSKEGITTVLIQSAGMADPELDVVYKDNTPGKIKGDSFTSNKNINIQGNISESDDNVIAKRASEITAISNVSEENKNIYEKSKDKIKKLFKK